MSQTERPILEPNERSQWDCVHRCPQCGHVLKLADLNLKAVTSGIAACPICNWTGQVQILIVERVQSTSERSIKEECRRVDCAVELKVLDCEDNNE